LNFLRIRTIPYSSLSTVMPFTCAIVEDQIMFRSMLKKLLVERCSAQIALELATLAELRAAAPTLGRLDLLVLDIRLPDGDGLDFIPEMNAQRIATPVLLLSSSGEDFVIHRVSRSLVQGYVHKDDDPDILVTAVQTITAGGSFFSPRFVERQRALARSDGFDKLLSDREQALLKLLGAGFSDPEVASQLGVTPATVHSHRRNIMAKLDLHSAQELQAYALRHGFTTVRGLRP
jgi:DNA-binding NarL/FixJ family response regulator